MSWRKTDFPRLGKNVLQSSDEHFVIDGQKTIYLNPVSGISLNISYQMGGLCALAGWKVERFCCDDLLLQCLLNIWTIMEVETFLPGFAVSHVNIFI